MENDPAYRFGNFMKEKLLSVVQSSFGLKSQFKLKTKEFEFYSGKKLEKNRRKESCSNKSIFFAGISTHT